MKTRITERYATQRELWPEDGRHILAHYDEDSVVVYQAYRPEIGHYAAEQQRFGGPFSLNRMSWIKPNFLWMMYRSGWGTKPGQEVTLSVRLRREAFDTILEQAVHSSYVPEVYGSQDEWKAAGASSPVRLQWDPDHAPKGAKQRRRAIQLGLRGDTLARHASEWILDIEDISAFVEEQRRRLDDLDDLVTPRERVYQVANPAVRDKLGLEPWGEDAPFPID